MSSVSPFSSNSEAIYAARLTSASAASSSNAGSAGTTVTATPETAPEDTVSLTHTDARELFQLGRVSYQEQAGKLTSAQGSQLDSLIQQLQASVQSDVQSNGSASLTSSQFQNINQLQDQLSHEIFADAHGLSNGSNSLIPPTTATT